MMTEQEGAQFESWWQAEGQYVRAGGGEYEKTFAFEAWHRQQKRIAELEAQLAAMKAPLLCGSVPVQNVQLDAACYYLKTETVFDGDGILATWEEMVRRLFSDKPVHPDDLAIDRFAAAMKAKMAASRAKGRNGWDNPTLCPAERLQTMLIEHLAKRDPIDIGNFAMMLFNRGEPVVAQIPGNAVCNSTST